MKKLFRILRIVYNSIASFILGLGFLGIALTLFSKITYSEIVKPWIETGSIPLVEPSYNWWQTCIFLIIDLIFIIFPFIFLWLSYGSFKSIFSKDEP